MSGPRHPFGPPLPSPMPGRHRGGCLRLGAAYGVLFSVVLFWGPLIAVIKFA